MIQCIQARMINIKRPQSFVGLQPINLSNTIHRCKIPHAAQQPSGNAWRATRTLGNFQRTILCNRHLQNARTALHDV